MILHEEFLGFGLLVAIIWSLEVLEVPYVLCEMCRLIKERV